MTLVWEYDELMDKVWHCKDTVEYSRNMIQWTSLTNVPVIEVTATKTNWVVNVIKPGFYKVRRERP